MHTTDESVRSEKLQKGRVTPSEVSNAVVISYL